MDLIGAKVFYDQVEQERDSQADGVKDYEQQNANAQAYDRASCQTAGCGPLRARLYVESENLSSQLYRTSRAHDILVRHPEFEELIELFGLVRVPMRIRPVQSFRAAVIE